MAFSERMWMAEFRGISSGPSLESSRMEDFEAGLVRYQNMSGRAAAARPVPAGGPVERRWRQADKRSAGVEQRHRTDERAHALGVAGPHLAEGQRRQRQADTGLHLGEPADVVGLEVEAVVEAAVDPLPSPSVGCIRAARMGCPRASA